MATLKTYLPPTLKLINLRSETELSEKDGQWLGRVLLQPAPPTSTSNVTGGVVFGAPVPPGGRLRGRDRQDRRDDRDDRNGEDE